MIVDRYMASWTELLLDAYCFINQHLHSQLTNSKEKRILSDCDVNFLFVSVKQICKP